MKKFNNKSGFTLIEIIVVLIIVGILAAIALPNLFSNIQKSKSAQALSQMDADKISLEACLAENGGTSPNAGTCTMTGQNLTQALTNGWTYSLNSGATANQSATLGSVIAPAGTFNTANSLTYSIVATDSGANTITLNRNTAGVWTCSTGTSSAYAGTC